jgi:hypothetical protein
MTAGSYDGANIGAPSAYRPAPVEREEADARPLATESWAYLIAGKDGTVWLAREYSVQDRMLQFVTTGDVRRQIPMTDVDRTATEQLNRERGIDLRLP